MMRQVLTVFTFLFAIAFSAHAQKKTAAEKATKQAEVITKYINSKFTDEAKHLTADQTEGVKQAYLDFYTDRATYRARKKELMSTYNKWKAAASKTVSAEEKDTLEKQKVAIAKENKIINKESKEMVTRRETKIKEALNEEQQSIFVQMREEQSKDSDEDSK